MKRNPSVAAEDCS